MQYSHPDDVDALSTRLPPLTHQDSDRKLPSISTVAGLHTLRGDSLLDDPLRAPYPSQQWPPLNGPLAFRQQFPPPFPLSTSRADSPATMDLDGYNSTTSIPSPDRHSSTNSVNLDDPDVRLAAEALGDLRADFVSSPPDTASPKFPGHSQTPSTSQCRSPQPEPLLSLLTTAHPLVASTIGGASSAYGGAKNFSPRFKSSAEYVEGYLTPIANTVNSVGRVTGVEGGVRWFLGARRNSTAAVNGNSKKRRKTGEADEIANKKSREMAIGDVDMSTLTPKSTRRSSSASTVDTLPAYDELRSPAYTESVVASSPHDTPRSVANTSWQSRLITSTSGLSIAMSAESLKSLKYCLKWLRWTNGHMSQVIGNLKSTLEEYEETAEAQIATSEGAEAHNSHSGGNESNQPDARTQEQAQEQARNELSAKINTLKVDVLKTLQETINLVSNYAGGALPENARVLVRRHLTSLPQRFRVASMTDSPAAHGDRDGDSAVREGAQKVLVLAKEGLDMVTQITGVVDDTIISAEQWCERMGKRRRVPNDGGQMDSPSVEPVGTSGDSRDDMMSAV